MEKRRHTRFTPKQKTFLVFRPGFQVLGEVRDISRGGVRLECVTDQDFAQDEHLLMDLYLSDGSFNLSKLPARVVRDTPVEDEWNFPSMLTTKHLALEFGELMPLQLLALESFLVSQKEGHA